MAIFSAFQSVRNTYSHLVSVSCQRITFAVLALCDIILSSLCCVTHAHGLTSATLFGWGPHQLKGVSAGSSHMSVVNRFQARASALPYGTVQRGHVSWDSMKRGIASSLHGVSVTVNKLCVLTWFCHRTIINASVLPLLLTLPVFIQ